MGTEQRIQFLTTTRGVRIAYAIVGDGPALVRTAPWLSHLEFEWQFPAVRSFYQSLARSHAVVRYDSEGCGLSERERKDFSFAAELRLLEEVIDHLKLEEFSLFGHDAGASLAIAYAANHPGRVSNLILFGAPGISRARSFDEDLPECFQALIKDHWRLAARLLANLHAPDVDGATLELLAELASTGTSGRNALEAARGLIYDTDISALLPGLRTRTAIIHRTKDCICPYESARELAARIPSSWLLPLEGRCHLPYLGDSAPVIEAIARILRDHPGKVAEKGVQSEEPASASSERGAIFRREGEYWTVALGGNACRIKDSQGMRHIAQLLRHPDREFQARELEIRSASSESGMLSKTRTASLEENSSETGSRLSESGDLGGMLDARAKNAYRQRLADLRGALAQAKSVGNVAGASELEEEISFLARELSRAVGLGGRDRRAGSIAERARLNVSRAIHRAIERIAAHDRQAGDLLRIRIRTGSLCVYREGEGSAIDWQL